MSVFISLSGFVLAYSNSKHDKRPNFGGYAIQKLNPLYPVHIITILTASFYQAVFVKYIRRELLINIALHVFMVQIWIPDPHWYATLNTPSWYLSVCMLSYLFFPLAFKWIKKLAINQMMTGIFICFLLQVAVSLFALYFGNPNENELLNEKWIVYFFPMSRIIDFQIGCFLGRLFFLYQNNADTMQTAKYHYVCELLVVTIIVYTWIAYARDLVPIGLKYVVIFTPTTISLLWFSGCEATTISKILNWKKLDMLADVSHYAFLIHNEVIKYCRLVSRMISSENSNIIKIVVSISSLF